MVVINEVYPSRREFIATYVDNKRKNAGITGLQNTKNTFRLTEPTPEPNQKPTLLFTSNFRKFVADIENHLSEILSNDRKIDNIHSAMNDINKLSTQPTNCNSEERPKSPGEEQQPKDQMSIDLSSVKSPRGDKSDTSSTNNSIINKNKLKTKNNRINRAKGGANIRNRNENAKQQQQQQQQQQEKNNQNPPPSPQERNQRVVAHVPGPAPMIKNKKALESQLKIKITSNYKTVVINREAFNSWYFKKYLSKPIADQQARDAGNIVKGYKDNNAINTTRASKLREHFFKYKTNNAATKHEVVSMPVTVVNLNEIQ